MKLFLLNIKKSPIIIMTENMSQEDLKLLTIAFAKDFIVSRGRMLYLFLVDTVM